MSMVGKSSGGASGAAVTESLREVIVPQKSIVAYAAPAGERVGVLGDSDETAGRPGSSRGVVLEAGIPGDITSGPVITHEFTVIDPEFPNCTQKCNPEWLGDGWCDTDCASPECGNDKGDCDGWCAPECKPSWVGDGFCDIDCFRQECNFDKNDCADNFTVSTLKIPLPPHDTFDYKDCPSSCDPTFLHDGKCDQACNNVACNLDGGDCRHHCSPTCANAWLGDEECDEGCNNPECHFDKGDCKICAPGCMPSMVANGICDIACNVAECSYDIGDCYGVCWAIDRVDYNSEPFTYPHCRDEWRGDGYCDCYCMTDTCNYDYGDCDGVDCSAEYALVSEINKYMNVSTPSPLRSPLPSTVPRRPRNGTTTRESTTTTTRATPHSHSHSRPLSLVEPEIEVPSEDQEIPLAPENAIPAEPAEAAVAEEMVEAEAEMPPPVIEEENTPSLEEAPAEEEEAPVAAATETTEGSSLLSRTIQVEADSDNDEVYEEWIEEIPSSLLDEEELPPPPFEP